VRVDFERSRIPSSTHEALVHEVEAGRRKLVRERRVSVALAGFLSSAGFLVLWSQRDPASVVLGALMLGAPPVVLEFLARSQRNIWRADGATTEDLLKLEIDRRADVARRMRPVPDVALAVLAATLLCRWLGPQRGPALSDLVPCILAAGAVGLAAIRRRKARKEKTQLMQRQGEGQDVPELDEPLPRDWATRPLEPWMLNVLATIDAEERRSKRQRYLRGFIVAVLAIVMGTVAGFTHEPRSTGAVMVVAPVGAPSGCFAPSLGRVDARDPGVAPGRARGTVR
jgi:hypothetical protein